MTFPGEPGEPLIVEPTRENPFEEPDFIPEPEPEREEIPA